jgi:kynureninase
LGDSHRVLSGRPAPELLYRSPNALAEHYSRFRVSERLLLTGHSHQAWPDCGFEGQVEAWNDAALYVDEKWERAFAKAERVRRGFARLLEDDSGDIALGSSTHELVVRFLSALPLRSRPKLVTTDAEFHTLRRQLARLEEEGVRVVRVSHRPAGEVAGRLIEALDDRTAAVLVSSVFYHNAHIVPHLGEVMRACARVGAELLVDVYHALNVVPFSLRKEGLEGAFVVGGGYKYCQLGEGNCFLRIPPGCGMRPVVTGWFAEFERLEEVDSGGRVWYPAGGLRFAGATYDPTSHYRAARVFDFFEERGLTPDFLREVSRHQVGVLAAEFDALDLDPGLVARDRSVSLESVAGFLALESPRARELVGELRKRGVMVDARGSLLRFGPAPYLCDDQLRQAMAALKEVMERS